MAGRTDRFLSELEASFEASLARDEDFAARDLARSFRNDENLVDVLTRCGGVTAELTDGTRLPVVEVGTDHVVAGTDADVIMRLERAIFYPGESVDEPVSTSISWLSVLRTWAGEAREVQVRVHNKVVAGSLVVAARDFLRIENRGGVVLLPHEAVTYVRSCPED